jgi:hypothetical protein
MSLDALVPLFRTFFNKIDNPAIVAAWLFGSALRSDARAPYRHVNRVTRGPGSRGATLVKARTIRKRDVQNETEIAMAANKNPASWCERKTKRAGLNDRVHNRYAANKAHQAFLRVRFARGDAVDERLTR